MTLCFFSLRFSDPPLSEEDIPSGLWLCHMCQMIKKQRALNATKGIANDDELAQSEIQRIKDSRPSTPITSDGVINAAKVRLNHKRSLSRVSSSSENSLSSDRDIKAKIIRHDSDQNSNSNGCEIIATIDDNARDTETIDVRNAIKDVEEHKESNDEVQPLSQQSEQEQSIEYLIEETSVEEHSDEKKDHEFNDVISSEDVIETNETNENPLEQITKIDEAQPIQDEEKMEIDENPNELAKETSELPSSETNEINEKPPEIIDVNENDESHVEVQPNAETTEVENDNDQLNSNNCEIDESEATQTSETDDETTTDFKSPFDELIRAASILNPRQFELPRELTIYPQFPGDEKG